MKELFDLHKELSLETDLEKRKEMLIKIEILRSSINSNLKTQSAQKIYKQNNGQIF